MDCITFVHIQRLTVETLDHLSHNICTICQLSFRARQFVAGISCGHGFHQDCLQRWIEEV